MGGDQDQYAAKGQPKFQEMPRTNQREFQDMNKDYMFQVDR